MATSFVISCPECEKQIKATTDLVGKKIRCKECGETFTVKAPKTPPKPKKPAPAKGKGEDEDKAKAPAAGKPTMDEDEEDAKNPYGLTYENMAARCPHCAAEMDPPDAVICVNCGYNTRTRTRAESRVVVETTGGDVFMWLLPGILCALAAIGLIVFDILSIIKFPKWLEGSFLQNEDQTWLIKPGAFSLWTTMISLIGIVPLTKFAIRRLVFNNKPPEVVAK